MSAAIIAMNHGRIEDAPNVLQRQIEGQVRHGRARSALIVVQWEDGYHEIQLFGPDMTTSVMAGAASLLSHFAAMMYLAQRKDE